MHGVAAPSERAKIPAVAAAKIDHQPATRIDFGENRHAGANRLFKEAGKTPLEHWPEPRQQGLALRHNFFARPFAAVGTPTPSWSGGIGVDSDGQRLPLSLAGTWVFELRERTDEQSSTEHHDWIYGDLTVLLANGSVDRELKPVLTSLSTELPIFANELAYATARGPSRGKEKVVLT